MSSLSSYLNAFVAVIVVYWLYAAYAHLQQRARQLEYHRQRRRAAGIPDTDKREFHIAAADAIARRRSHPSAHLQQQQQRQQQQQQQSRSHSKPPAATAVESAHRHPQILEHRQRRPGHHAGLQPHPPPPYTSRSPSSSRQIMPDVDVTRAPAARDYPQGDPRRYAPAHRAANRKRAAQEDEEDEEADESGDVSAHLRRASKLPRKTLLDGDADIDGDMAVDDANVEMSQVRGTGDALSRVLQAVPRVGQAAIVTRKRSAEDSSDEDESDEEDGFARDELGKSSRKKRRGQGLIPENDDIDIHDADYEEADSGSENDSDEEMLSVEEPAAEQDRDDDLDDDMFATGSDQQRVASGDDAYMRDHDEESTDGQRRSLSDAQSRSRSRKAASSKNRGSRAASSTVAVPSAGAQAVRKLARKSAAQRASAGAPATYSPIKASPKAARKRSPDMSDDHAIGEEWTDENGLRWRIGDDATRRRAAVVVEMRSKHSMPKGSKHPDALLKVPVHVERFVTEKEYNELAAQNKLSWQEAEREEAREEARREEQERSAKERRADEERKMRTPKKLAAIYSQQSSGHSLFRPPQEQPRRSGEFSRASSLSRSGSSASLHNSMRESQDRSASISKGRISLSGAAPSHGSSTPLRGRLSGRGSTPLRHSTTSDERQRRADQLLSSLARDVDRGAAAPAGPATKSGSLLAASSTNGKPAEVGEAKPQQAPTQSDDKAATPATVTSTAPPVVFKFGA
ncbi:hypothetical protein IE81DRAFT_325897 [Ceraceosorus guamensis]|uniref:Uncharacterized protein n=1 Tax=Ceraceosorus guamensis TaxID=1522189 RepID=A0A316VSA2_9BASI|nr:hypothetical protein IE81DRAFT_325897 [Ceraceosorus guamensis]PWN40094.1 hypothetical protein IE81DRAFT_325897 [Ceraceosorus guamensis]